MARTTARKITATAVAEKLHDHLRYMVPEIRLALIQEVGHKPQPINCPSDVEKFLEPLKHYAEEHFVSLHLDAKSHVIGYQIVSHGTLSSSLVHPREVFKAALVANSYALIVAHNHPTGELTPSPEDIDTTQQLIRVGKLLSVPVVDHIIVGVHGIRSIRETNSRLWGD